MIVHAHWAECRDWPADRWPNFSPHEMACKRHCGALKIDENFLDALQDLRVVMGAPLVVSSGYRCPEYNVAVSATGPDGPHVQGRAADILISGEPAFVLLTLAVNMFDGIGVKQHGPHEDRFIHLDNLAEPEFPRPRIWTYR